MRIVQVLHYFLPRHKAGVETYTYYLSKELLKRNDVFIFTFEDGYYDKEFYKSDDIYHNLSVRRIYYNRPITFEQTYKNDYIAQKFEEYLDEIKPDVVHFHHFINLSVSLINVVRKRKIPLVVTLHDFWFICPQIHLLTTNNKICPGPDSGNRCINCKNILPGQIGRQSSKLIVKIKKLINSFVPSRIKTFLEKRFIQYKIKKQKITKHSFNKRIKYLKKMLKKVDIIIAPSLFLREKYIEFGIPAEKILYLDYGFNKKLFTELKRKTSKNIRFGYIGTLYAHKGVEILIKAFNKIKNSNATLKIHGWGSITYLKKIKALSKKNKKITIHKSFENQDIGRLYYEIDVLVVPSIWYENSPLVIHEAFLAKTPVITSNIGGMAEYVKYNETGLLFEVGNVNDLVKKIKLIINTPELIKKLSQNINPDKLVMSIEENARKLESIYRKTS